MTSPPPGPPELGRGVIVAAGQQPPPPWVDAPVVRVDERALLGPDESLERLAVAWRRRSPVVVELGVDPARFREPESITDPVWSIDPGLDLPHERLHHLVWANNWDARDGEPVWWWARKALGLGAGAGGDADVVLADGSPAWIDGGPRWSVPRLGVRVVHAGSVDGGRLIAVEGDHAEPVAALAPDQLAAVGHAGGPVRVIAPAGSGKTRVLTERIRHLLGDRGYDRKALLAVAYNKGAQVEMEERLADVEPRTRTLNSLGYAILARHLDRRPRVADEGEVRQILDDVFPIPRRRANTDPVGPYLDALTAVRLGLRDPDEVEAGRDDVPGFADGFESYRVALRRSRSIDFDEQIYASLEALLAEGRFRRAMQVEHRHLLVDEFQDLTPAHLLMIRLLAMPAFDVCGVGDDDQTIYDHAGADPRFLVDYGRYFPGAGEAALEVNYRCARRITEGAANLLAYNQVRVAKTIRSGDEVDCDPGALAIEEHPPEQAANALTGLVSDWLGEAEVGHTSIAVLTRVNSLLLAPQIALWSAGVPVRSPVGAELLERTGMAAALAWIRVAVDPGGLIAADLEVIRRRPSRGFPNWISKWFANCRSIADLERIESRIDDERVARKVAEMCADIEMLSGLAGRGATTRELLEAVRDRIGLGAAMEMLDGSKGTEATASHLDDLDALIQVADLGPQPGEFEPWLRASLTESAGGEGGLTLSTVHRVKGREWDRVVVYGANAGLMPHRLASDWEAERRVMHVAITRARHRCVILVDAERRSPFIDEISGTAEAAAGPMVARAAFGDGAARRDPAKVPDTPLATALRVWRSERSRADNVPAYVVINNRSLVAITEAMPADESALLRCEGIGPTKLERYGEEILALVDSHRHARRESADQPATDEGQVGA